MFNNVGFGNSYNMGNQYGYGFGNGFNNGFNNWGSGWNSNNYNNYGGGNFWGHHCPNNGSSELFPVDFGSYGKAAGEEFLASGEFPVQYSDQVGEGLDNPNSNAVYDAIGFTEATYDEFDTNGDGELAKKEMKSAFQDGSMNNRQLNRFTNRYLAATDLDGNGRLSQFENTALTMYQDSLDGEVDGKITQDSIDQFHEDLETAEGRASIKADLEELVETYEETPKASFDNLSRNLEEIFDDYKNEKVYTPETNSSSNNNWGNNWNNWGNNNNGFQQMGNVLTQLINLIQNMFNNSSAGYYRGY